ncbi:hypothetical protein [Streptomyces sp. BA2]|uniref:hypothetical protein n=1 Tax=Streptomyces sp. BA2 TaxID=436595 RepID=UPI0013284A00|nr:hypothetical protein [Streptomyces sp. BA2]MWA12851.1 hypothetical protein [Streptomyces sp. BA2]
MANPLSIEEAVPRFRDLLTAQADAVSDPLSAALQAFTEFARIDFAVPAGPDTDGCLVEYGVNSLAGEPLGTLKRWVIFRALGDRAPAVVVVDSDMA